MDRRSLLQILGSAAIAPALDRLPLARRIDIGRALHTELGLGLRVLTPAQNACVVAVADQIIPKTESPGATDAKVNEFVDLLLDRWYDDDDKAQFLRGLDKMDAEAQSLGGTTFANASPDTQHTLLVRWDSSVSGPETATAGYKRLHGVVVYAWITSETMVKDVLKPVIFHPAFEGCVPYTAGRLQ